MRGPAIRPSRVPRAKREADLRRRADVAHRGEAGADGGARRSGRRAMAAYSSVSTASRQNSPLGIAGEVDVHVDQAGQHGAARKVDQPGARRRRLEAGGDALDAAVDDGDGRRAAAPAATRRRSAGRHGRPGFRPRPARRPARERARRASARSSEIPLSPRSRTHATARPAAIPDKRDRSPGARFAGKRPGRSRALSPSTPADGAGRLPEEVVDHVDHFAGVDVDQQDVVIIAHPLGARRGRRQPVLPGIADPVVTGCRRAARRKKPIEKR